MNLRDKLPLGFGFYPTDEELVCHYLHKKITNEEIKEGTLVEIDLNITEPWQLPANNERMHGCLEVAKLNSNEWYFFSSVEGKRATSSGFWKDAEHNQTVLDRKTGEVGMRKTLVFYKHGAPNDF
ncbi:NAC domain containing protein 74 [Forsythia ovata]|uniref:NAC domain containing protein 74 n=1 Tax=Forsythia ovata TaxID=205694 RepID=A0ABD1X4G2_9LAMI